MLLKVDFACGGSGGNGGTSNTPDCAPDCNGANLTNADLRGADLKGATWRWTASRAYSSIGR